MKKVTAMGRTKPEIRMVSVEGRDVRMAHWDAGDAGQDALPVLFFNGIGANMELIAPFAERLGRNVITFDMPGVGGSPDPVWPYRPWMMARVADKILDELGYAEVDVMGISWGGAMAQQYAIQYAKRTNRLVLIATTAGELIHQLTNPRKKLTKRYRIGYSGELSSHAVERCAKGMMLDGDPRPTLPAKLVPLDEERGLKRAILFLSEGRYHQVRRMIAALGGTVHELHRDKIGGLELPSDLAPGQCRALDERELRRLMAGDDDGGSPLVSRAVLGRADR